MLILFGFLGAVAFAAHNAGKYYQVDMILFHPQHIKALETEANPRPLLLHQPTAQLGSEDQQKAHFQNLLVLPLLSRNLQHNQIADQRIQNSNNYQLIGHYSWRQHIGSKQNIIYFNTAELMTSNNPDTELGNNAQTSEQQAVNIEGHLHFSRLRFIHLKAHLLIKVRAAAIVANAAKDEHEEQADSTSTVDHWTSMVQTRRMRSNQLHYIDHPTVGMLISLTPLS